jgi:hypothetical protein
LPTRLIDCLRCLTQKACRGGEWARATGGAWRQCIFKVGDTAVMQVAQQHFTNTFDTSIEPLYSHQVARPPAGGSAFHRAATGRELSLHRAASGTAITLRRRPLALNPAIVPWPSIPPSAHSMLSPGPPNRISHLSPPSRGSRRHRRQLANHLEQIRSTRSVRCSVLPEDGLKLACF